MTRRQRFSIGLQAAIVLVALAVATRATWLPWPGEFLVCAQAPEKADIVVVLGGEWRGRRILHAAELVREGYAPHVLVSGAGYLYGAHEADLAVQYAVSQGCDPSIFIKFKHAATSTADEALFVVPELRRLHIRKYLLVTSNYHTRRAGRIFRAVGPDLQPIVVSSDSAYLPVDSWWKQREPRKIFFEEWTKTLANYIGI